MKNFILLLLWPVALFSQTELFRVETIETNLSWKENPISKLEHYSPYFYEDENYIVTSKCRGEFGGRIFFKDKKTDVVSIAYATCPVILHKINNKYHLTTSLDHATGFYEIYEIDDPDELTVQVNDTLL